MSDEVTLLNVGGVKVGLVGLSDVFEDVGKQNTESEEQLRRLLIDKVKATNYVPAAKEDAYADALLREYKRFLGEEVAEEDGVLTIRILGPGCYNCDKLMQDTMAILAELGIAADIEHVRDPTEIARYGMVATPALVVNGNVLVSGRVPTRARLRTLLEAAITATQ